MTLIFTQKPPPNIPAAKTMPKVQKVTYIVKDAQIRATEPIQAVEQKLLTKVLYKAEVTYGMLKAVHPPKSCCNGAK